MKKRFQSNIDGEFSNHLTDHHTIEYVWAFHHVEQIPVPLAISIFENQYIDTYPA